MPEETTQNGSHSEPPKVEATIKQNFEKKDIDDNKLIACLSYIGFLFLIPMFAKKDSKFCQEHAKQGLVFFLAGIALSIIWAVPLLGWLIGFVGWILMLAVGLAAIIKTLQGEFWEIPVIGQYRHKFNL